MTTDLAHPGARRPTGYRHRKRTTASIVLLIGFILTPIAVGTGWWSVSGGGSSIYFLPGSSPSCSPSCPGIFTYTGDMLTLYQGIDYMIIAALVLALVAMVFAFLGAFGVSFGRGQLTLVLLLGLVSAFLALAPAIWVVFGQPAAFQSTGSCAGVTASYCTSFFYGSQSGSSWGPYVGWYAALLGFLFLIIGALLYFRTRMEPFTMEELHSAVMASQPPSGVPSPPGAPPGWAPPPPTAQPSAAATASAWSSPVSCPRCGASNPSTAATCWRCQVPLR